MIKKRNIVERDRDNIVFTDYAQSSFASKIIGIAPSNCELVSLSEIHRTKGTSASAVTLGVERLRDAQTSGSGDLAVSGLSLKSDNNDMQISYPTSSNTYKYFGKGDRIGLVLSGTSTGLGFVNIAVNLRPCDEIPYYEASSSISSSVSSSASSSDSTSSSVSSSPSSSASVSSSVSSSVSASVSSSVSSSASISSSVSSSVSSSASISSSVSSSPSL